MEKYSFFDAVQKGGSYDRTYNAADIAEYFSSFIGNGVFANPANSLKVYADTSTDTEMRVKVAPGKAFIDGYYYHLDSEMEVNLEVGEGADPRIDLICCSLNLSKRLIEIRVIKGTPSRIAEQPLARNDKEVHDLVLAGVYVKSGAIHVRQQDITDYRPNDDFCGFVKSTVDTIETKDLFKQYEETFKTFFNDMKTTLSGDVAGNLALKINKNKEEIETLDKKVDSNIKNDTLQTTAENGLVFIKGQKSGHVAMLTIGVADGKQWQLKPGTWHRINYTLPEEYCPLFAVDGAATSMWSDETACLRVQEKGQIYVRSTASPRNWVGTLTFITKN